jgi:hypothetical protein
MAVHVLLKTGLQRFKQFRTLCWRQLFFAVMGSGHISLFVIVSEWVPGNTLVPAPLLLRG